MTLTVARMSPSDNSEKYLYIRSMVLAPTVIVTNATILTEMKY